MCFSANFVLISPGTWNFVLYLLFISFNNLLWKFKVYKRVEKTLQSASVPPPRLQYEYLTVFVVSHLCIFLYFCPLLSPSYFWKHFRVIAYINMCPPKYFSMHIVQISIFSFWFLATPHGLQHLSSLTRD